MTTRDEPPNSNSPGPHGGLNQTDTVCQVVRAASKEISAETGHGEK